MTGVIRCATPAERAALAMRIRAKRDELGYTAAQLRVQPKGAFSIEVASDDAEIFDQFFTRKVRL